RKHCGSSTGYGKVTFGSGTRLVVTPKLEPSEPSVYKLQSPKEEDRDISACLITDFSPAPIRVGADGIDEHEVNGSVVVVKESGKETPSYGKVIWGKAKEADGCYAEQNNNRFPSESAEAATTCSEKTTGGFETDESVLPSTCCSPSTLGLAEFRNGRNMGNISGTLWKNRDMYQVISSTEHT
ncbi:M1-specific T cell receptor alpha chain-like, partial [Podarcis lilfordi]